MIFSNEQDGLGQAQSNSLGYIKYIKLQRIYSLKFSYIQ